MLCLIPGFAMANSNDQQTSTKIEASVPASCTIEVSTIMDFGTYDATSAHRTSQLVSAGTPALLTVNCNKGVRSYDISFGAGAYSTKSNTCRDRRMKNEDSNSYLSYGLYSTSTYTDSYLLGCREFNEKTIGTNISYTSGGVLYYQDGPFSQYVYGNIPGGQGRALAGNYSDSVDVTIYF